MNWNPPKSFHATNPFGNVIEDATHWETLTDNPQVPTIADMFSELMSDYISNTEQNMENGDDNRSRTARFVASFP